MWHTVTLSFEGPSVSEADPATFLDYRLTVVFANGSEQFAVPGFFAADGRAASSHATAGNVWQARFTPNRPGHWSYQATLSTGPRIAIADPDNPGEPIDLAGHAGSFEVSPSPVSPTSRDFRGRGRLATVGKHHLQFAGTGGPFLKGGAGSPENLLGYYGFDGTFDAGGSHYPSLGEDQLHHFKPHAGDWKAGDPNWTDEDGDEGKNLVGYVNYLAEAGLNSQYLITLTYQGDGWEVWPWTRYDQRETFDVSKLDQWEILFSLMERKGILLHILLTETENESLFEHEDGGPFAHTRKLYYRELVARFGHHLALIWNLGEENGHSTNLPWGEATTSEQMKLFSSYLKQTDPYKHPIVVHHYPFEQDKVLGPLLGHSDFDGASLQLDHVYLEKMGWDFNQEVLRWIQQSKAHGHPWLVQVDEPLGWEYGLVTDDDTSGSGVGQDQARKELLWGSYMAGAAGVEWYFGWKDNSPSSDLGVEDMRLRANMWAKTRYATEFFMDHIPLLAMASANDLLSGARGYVLAEAGRTYLVYLQEGGEGSLDLAGQGGDFAVRWFDPRNGGNLQVGSVAVIAGGARRSLGFPPSEPKEDWAVLVTAVAVDGSGQ